MTLPHPRGAATPDSQPHFDGLAAGRVLLPRCERCGHVFWYPRHHCPACGSAEVGWLEASGRGSVYSFSIVRRGQGAYAEAAPYVLAYVELEEGPRLLTNLVVPAAAIDRLAIGDPVVAVIESEPGELPLLRFRPAG